MLAWRELACLTDDELGLHDVAAVNLACAEGLPGTEHVDAAKCLATLDSWAEKVRQWTAGAYREFFLPNPGEFNNSKTSFRIIALLTVLSRHCGVRYEPSKVGLTLCDGKFDVHEPFVFGVTDGPGGTCASLPVVYAAVGRRLGYPIRLVTTKCHLQSLTPRRELASFIAQRAFQLTDLGRYREAVETFIVAAQLEPHLLTYPHCAVQWLAKWREKLQVEFPPGYPLRIEVSGPGDRRRWPWVDQEIERDLEILLAAEICLRLPLHEELWGAATGGTAAEAASADRHHNQIRGSLAG
jgi:hypothetical protein